MRKTHLVGTIRRNRKYLPKKVLNRKLNVNELYGLETAEGKVVSKWKPKKNKDVLMLSTLHDLEMSPVPNKRGRQVLPELPVRVKPTVVLELKN
ncbi:hypothetical protein NQ314_004365 [Rhamnusium bicolor]|uniref:PiggyBac transposable element-derived protein domain-containing protein n=1 Tax=Rhamnusium bicolor TaxID=1586634 RepID=A0AAV8ZLL5_9CUCU|nr:hypothetical protein NQ314_004365 [Rhamnusium bicolor]